MLAGTFDTTIQNANIQILLGSGAFPLKFTKKEKFSVALVFGENLEDIIFNKDAAQIFYNNNYRLPDSLTEIDGNSFALNPKNFYLFQNYPNPFNPITSIKYSLQKEGLASLKVYDVLGKEVATLVNEFKNTGSYAVSFNAESLSSGVYFYRLQAGSFVETKKMILLK